MPNGHRYTEKADYGIINIYASGTNEVRETDHHPWIVPKEPEPRVGTLFLWPGNRAPTGHSTFNPVGLGVLQPVLTWGTSCVRWSDEYDTWWISDVRHVNYAESRVFRAVKAETYEGRGGV